MDPYRIETRGGQPEYLCNVKGCTYSTGRSGRMSRHIEEAHDRIVSVPDEPTQSAGGDAGGELVELLRGNVAAVRERVQVVTDLAQLTALLEAEEGERGAHRKGVIEAILERRSDVEMARATALLEVEDLAAAVADESSAEVLRKAEGLEAEKDEQREHVIEAIAARLAELEAEQ